ncbi:FAD-dependent oxidoreductase [Acetomicrobium sp.]|uniref:FAD-dependent oxidoreductase n=1 Tax=Acetomicrobium sp. TaxID=1872099 RepID=UPI002FC9A4F0
MGPFKYPLKSLYPRIWTVFWRRKNLSMTRLASGALRLQPITMLTGQAAGTIAAAAVKEGVPPREVNVLKVQRILLEAGDRLSLCVFSDVPPNHPFWPAVQMATIRGWMKPESLLTLPPQGQTIITISCRHRERDALRGSLAWMSP